MNIKHFFLGLIFIPFLLSAKPINKSDIKDLGIKAFKQKIDKYSAEKFDFSLRNCDFLSENGELYAAIFHFDKGFLILAADDAVVPVLAYDFDNDIDLNNIAPATQQLLDQYKNEILAVRRNNLAPDQRAINAWKELKENSVRSDAQSVGPLLSSTWNQNKYYNYFSPEDDSSPEGYDNKTPNGCVAVAMSQIMYYYRYPKHGTGSHTNHSAYGNFYVNFAQQTYNYDAMNDNINFFNTEVAKLIYHCGIAVDMMYGPDGSGAYSHNVPSAMSGYFGYNNSVQHRGKDSYSNSNWNEMLKQELTKKRPIYYSGYSSEGGHAFVCDGFNDEDYFHFNFGWGGYGNGYFVTSSTSSDESVTGGYSDYQSAIFNLYPREDNYPEYCNDRVLTALYGTLEDGSGNKDYKNNQYCTYIITAPNQYCVNIVLKSVETEENHDFIRFWNGHPSKDSLLLEVSGGMPAQTNYMLNTDSLYITFETDDDSTAAGWKLYYQSYREIESCGNHASYDAAGTINDNSAEFNYRDNSNCIWNIRVNNAEYITFTFNEFDVSPEDHLDFYDISHFPATLLESFSGNEIPNPVTYYTSKIRVNFVSDNYLNAGGFDISWQAYLPDAIEDCCAQFMEIYPNPASDYININLNDLKDESFAISLYDVVGKCIYTENYSNTSKIQIPSYNLNEGIYLLKIQNRNSEKYTYKKIVIKH